MEQKNIFESIKDFFIRNKDNNKMVAVFIVGALAVGFALFSDYGLVKRVSLEMKRSELIEAVEQETKTKDSLKARVEQLKTDDLEIERIARKRYGMIKEGEKVYFKQTEE